MNLTIGVFYMRYLTFALCKGRLAKQTLELLEKLGITCEEMKDKASRKLIFVNEDLKLRFFLAKGPDVPTYVEYGAADIGVVGKDIILEDVGRSSGQLPNIRASQKTIFLDGNIRLWRSSSSMARLNLLQLWGFPR